MYANNTDSVHILLTFCIIPKISSAVHALVVFPTQKTVDQNGMPISTGISVSTRNFEKTSVEVKLECGISRKRYLLLQHTSLTFHRNGSRIMKKIIQLSQQHKPLK